MITQESAATLADKLSAEVGATVGVTLTQNRRVLVSVRALDKRSVAMRLHRVFTAAGPGELGALARCADAALKRARVEPGVNALLRAFVSANQEAFAAHATPRAVSLVSRGAVYDLEDILRRVCEVDVGYPLPLRIGWGTPRRYRRRPRSLRLGSYHPLQRLIRIHPILDQPQVPEYFIRFVVFHEVLHYMIPPVDSGGRALVHSREFRVQERAHPDYERALAWERTEFPRLLAAFTRRR